jgi:hypothetical protein
MIASRAWESGPREDNVERRTAPASLRTIGMTHMDEAIPEVVRASVVQVCRDAFHWRSDVQAVLLSAGVLPEVYDRYDQPENSKAKIARLVLADLQQSGVAGRRVQRAIVEELCRMDRPHRDAPDQDRGKAALADLKRHATPARVLIDPERAAAAQRRASAERQQRAVQQRQQQLGELRDRFFELALDRPRTRAELQKRGYALEALLADLFETYDLTYRRPYRLTHEQVDGSFHFRGFTYNVEAKWEAQPPDFSDLAKFKFNVDGKLDSTRGMFVAMAGFDVNTLAHFFSMSHGSRMNIILVDHLDLTAIFEGRFTLPDALIAKVDVAEQEGRAWYPLGR